MIGRRYAPAAHVPSRTSTRTTGEEKQDEQRDPGPERHARSYRRRAAERPLDLARDLADADGRRRSRDRARARGLSVVTLALPDILREFDVEIPQVAWVLTSYNLVLALAAVPAALRRAAAARARVRRRDARLRRAPRSPARVAPSFGVLVAARCVQALGGALLVCAALDLLTEVARLRAGRRADLGPGRGRRRRARAGRRRDPDRDARLGVDLLRAGAARAAHAGRRRRSACPAAVRAGGASERRPRTSRCCFSPARSRPRCSCSCCCSSTGGAWPPAVAGVVVTVMPVAAIVTASFAAAPRDDGDAGRDRRRARRQAVSLRSASSRLGLVVDDRPHRSSSARASASRCLR